MGNAPEVGKGWKFHELIRAEITGRFHVEMSQIKTSIDQFMCVLARESC